MSSKNVFSDEDSVVSVNERASDVERSGRFTVRDAIESADELLAGSACTECGEELRPTVELERQGRIDYDWMREANLGHPYGRTLAEEERQLGEEAELAGQRERALAAAEAGVDRAGSASVQNRRESGERVRDFRERGVLGAGGDPGVDPREQLDVETLGDVNRYGMKLAGRFRGPSRAALAKRLAEKVACQGMGVTAAVLETKKEVAKGVDAMQPIASIDEWMGHPRYSIQANVEGKVRTLYEPAASNQQQVGIIEDESGTAKLTVWKRSNVGSILSEGDRVRLLNVEVGWYGGRASLAATSRSNVTVLEAGDGLSPRN
jgi:hypothetical protein